VRLSDIASPPPPESPADWNDSGVLIIKDFLAPDLVDDYINEWLDAHWVTDRYKRGRSHARWRWRDGAGGGWQYDTPYMEHAALRALCCHERLAGTLEALIGEPAGVHLNLTGWVTTGRDWHQDSYLNPPHVGDYYAAVWFALDHIHEDSGPFQYVPGSHRWPQVTQEAIGRFVNLADRRWPAQSEQILTPLFAEEIHNRRAEIVTYLPEEGDVLIWHGRLLHRGSLARQPGLERRALIAHYSGIHHRPDMPESVQHGLGGYYFPIVTRPR